MKSSNYSHCKDSFLFRTALYFAILEISFCESEGKTLETFNAKKRHLRCEREYTKSTKDGVC